MLEKPEWLLSTTLVGTNIAVVTNTTMATALMLHLFGDNGSWLAVVLVAPLIWIFGEIVPKSVFQQRADALTPVVIFVLRFFRCCSFPILVVFSFLTNVLTKIAGGDAKNPSRCVNRLSPCCKCRPHPAVTSIRLRKHDQKNVQLQRNHGKRRDAAADRSDCRGAGE